MYKNVYKYDDMKRREHMAVRENVGWYLWTHQLIEVQGKDAAAFLDLLFTKPIANLAVGRERYTTMLNDAAEIIDDVVVFRMEEDKFWVSTLFATKMLRWMGAHVGTMDAAFKNITEQYHMYAVQGPRAKELVNALVAEPVDSLKFFAFAENKIGELPVMINRAGFTGEKCGYEIYVAAEKVQELEDAIRQVGDSMGAVEVTEFQIMAWTLPTEAGFYYMRDLAHTNPFEAGLDQGINWDKEFIGKEALLKIKEEGASREMVGFTLEDTEFCIESRQFGGAGQAVLVDGEEIGRVYKLVYSYVKETNIGYIMADKGAVKVGDHVQMHGHDAVIVEKKFI